MTTDIPRVKSLPSDPANVAQRAVAVFLTTMHEDGLQEMRKEEPDLPKIMPLSTFIAIIEAYNRFIDAQPPGTLWTLELLGKAFDVMWDAMMGDIFSDEPHHMPSQVN